MPLPVEEDLFARANRLLSEGGMPAASLGLECDPTGAWLIWVDGSRALIDQGRGVVQGALDLIQSRLAGASSADEGTAKSATGETHADKHGTEGGLGLATVAQFWSGSSLGIGPRLDVSVGPPGKFAFLLGEEALFGTGSGSSGLVVFDFQGGAAYGAPFKSRTGLGVVAMLGAERVSASHDNSSNGLSSWALTGNLGARASLAWSSTNIWLGADLLVRSSDFQTGGPSPVSIPSASFVLSLGCFIPAFSR